MTDKERIKELEKQLRDKESEGLRTFRVMNGIIETMVDSKLDPKEFYTFFQKYAEFLRFGVINKKIQAQGSVDYDEINKDQAITAGANCLESFLADFNAEYERESIVNA